jgi:hypothetical protein
MTGIALKEPNRRENAMKLPLVGCASVVMALGLSVYLSGSAAAQQLQ